MFRNKKILILGSSSFSGATLVNYLLDKNLKIFGTYNKKKNIYYLPYRKNKNFKYFKSSKIDLEKRNSGKLLNSYIKKIKPDCIIDFASICMVNESWNKPDKYFKINCLSKIDLIKQIYNLKFIKKFIYISTPEVFGETSKNLTENLNIFKPSTPYATSKMVIENLIKNYETTNKKKFIIARFSNFYGPAQPSYRLIPKIVLSIKKKSKFPLHGKGLSKRNYIFSDDFCEGIYRIIVKGAAGSTYHFSDKNLYSVRDIINKVCKLMKVNPKKILSIKKDRIGKDNIYKLRSDKTEKDLSWKSKVKIDDGIKKMIDYIENNYKHLKKESMNFKI